jgi:uncharacterized phage-associated protein
MFNAKQTAEAFLALCYEQGYPLSNRKLQMLMYYAQGWHLAYEDEPLFEEPIMAEPSGIVIHSIQQRYKGHGPRPIKVFLPDANFPRELQHRVEEIWSTYGEKNDYELEQMIKEEAPWLSAREGLTKTDIRPVTISNGSMWVFFQDMLPDNRKEEVGQN